MDLRNRKDVENIIKRKLTICINRNRKDVENIIKRKLTICINFVRKNALQFVGRGYFGPGSTHGKSIKSYKTLVGRNYLADLDVDYRLI